MPAFLALISNLISVTLRRDAVSQSALSKSWLEICAGRTSDRAVSRLLLGPVTFPETRRRVKNIFSSRREASARVFCRRRQTDYSLAEKHRSEITFPSARGREQTNITAQVKKYSEPIKFRFISRREEGGN